jgi:chemotaxis protein MotA
MKIDLATISGILIGAIGLIAGLRLEGIEVHDMGQLTAAFIVFFGTAGAVLISTPLDQIKKSLKLLPEMIRNTDLGEREVIDQLLKYAKASRLRGLLSLDSELRLIEDPFFRNAMQLAVDAVPAESITDVLHSEVTGLRSEAESAASFYEAAGGYAPTLGMAGAAIGLIQVMKHLEHIDQVGMGVAAAFVATIYGVLLANLILLPIATKIRARAESRVRICGLIREGVLLIVEGANPTLIRMRLEALAQLKSDPGKRREHAPALSAQIGRS